MTPDHSQVTGHRADLVCAIDHIGDGYSLAPDQHKHLWIGAREDGAFVCYPQDRYLVRESSFTKVRGVPVVYRQRTIWSVEP